MDEVKKYQIIYADPPWKYTLFRETASSTGVAEKYYEVMDLLDLAKLPLKNIADKNCALFMWATYPALPTAFKLLREWEFYYRTVAFTWVKRNKKADSWFWGMGSWTRANAEICLLATRGTPKRMSKSVHSVLDDRIREHSKKPDEARKRIVELMGDLPRIELFARKPDDMFNESYEGWDVWGNEVESDIELNADSNKSI